MNSVSWFLYLADVLSSLSIFASLASLGAIACICALWCGASFALIEANRDEKANIRASRMKWTFRLVTISIIVGVFACVIPSKNTMYAIAASQVGEQIAKNPQVQEMAGDATKALQLWIKKQIDPDKKS